MKFRNVSDDARDIPALGVTVEPGETTPELEDDVAEGFVGQAEVWAAVGSEAKKHQKEAVQEQQEPSEGDS